MAKKKAAPKYPDIQKFAGLNWEKEEGVKPEPNTFADCNFCGGEINEEDDHFYLADIEGCSLDPFLYACKSCGTLAGLEW